MDHIVVAEEFFDTQSYSKSTDAYQKAFDKQEGSMHMYYQASSAAALAGEVEMAIQWLDKSIEKGWSEEKSIEKDPDLLALHKHEKWPTLVEKVKQNHALLDHDQANDLYDLNRSFRLTAANIRDFEKIMNSKSPKLIEMKRKLQQHDSLKLSMMCKILDEKGWQGYLIQDVSKEKSLYSVLSTADLETQEKYFPLLEQAVAEGKTMPQYLASLTDIINLKKGEKQVYGTQMAFNNITNTFYVRPLLEPNLVDEKRSKMELPPMKSTLKIQKLEWDVTTYLNTLPQILEYEQKVVGEIISRNIPIKLMEIDQPPLHPKCKNEKNIENQNKCFSENIQKLVSSKFNFSMTSEIGAEIGTHKIIVYFEIDETGQIADIQAYGTHALFEEEAKRVVLLLPKLKPALKNGIEVSVSYSLPISFIIVD